MNNNFDIVIIGSGLGGLECALILSKEGYKVCVLEQASVFGGCLQSFMRRGRNIDTGIHYVGSMGEGQIMRQYLKYFGIFDKLSIIELDNDFDVIRLGDKEEYSYKAGYDNFIASLVNQFPSERGGIEKYFQKIKEIGSSINTDVHKSGRFSSGGVDNLSVSASDFIDSCVTNKTLRNVLAGTNVLYGGVRDKSNLYHHAMINHSNIEGSYRFVGGTQKVADLMINQIVDNGGVVMNKSKVISINVDGDKVTSVDIEGGEPIFGKHFISNLHPAATFNMVGETPNVKKAYRSRLNLLPNTYGLFSVYLLMKPGSFPYINKNYYYYHNNDTWDTILGDDLQPRCVMLSTQLSESDSKYSDVVTLMAPIDSNLFNRWGDTLMGRRGGDYNDLKSLVASKIIEYSDRFCPLLKESIEYSFSASPLTYVSYTGTPAGSAYGIIKDSRYPLATLIPARTRLNNLFLTGQNLNVHGALGVTLTAATTCAELIGGQYLAQKVGSV